MTNEQMAEAIGRSRDYFQHKLNDSKFTILEAKIIKDELGISDKEFVEMFFK
jgi:hypothetical protein